ncbi:CHC2-type zinc finger protein [Nitrosomonas nitrosa]|uniref:CHC2 zinc finger domain-containing protein n=1 Tax=Nitrosomonas nitrosa TaxID=52442 RepID=UPI000D3201F2|nr:CHC2 zinc finger domain-containing protein [Nitrosomonas nitrosa]PTQ88346.1 CHC2-type zinc finger protein [Nitrosomonas nitrosa]
MTFKMKTPNAEAAVGAKAIQNDLCDVPILSHFSNLKQTSANTWTGRCPMPDHKDTNPSFRATQKPNGDWLLYCHGCGARGKEICNALGIPISSLFANSKPYHHTGGNSRVSSVFTLLRSMEPDLFRLVAIANLLEKSGALDQSDREFISGLAIKLNSVIDEIGGGKK